MQDVADEPPVSQHDFISQNSAFEEALRQHEEVLRPPFLGSHTSTTQLPLLQPPPPPPLAQLAPPLPSPAPDQQPQLLPPLDGNHTALAFVAQSPGAPLVGGHTSGAAAYDDWPMEAYQALPLSQHVDVNRGPALLQSLCEPVSGHTPTAPPPPPSSLPQCPPPLPPPPQQSAGVPPAKEQRDVMEFDDWSNAAYLQLPVDGGPNVSAASATNLCDSFAAASTPNTTAESYSETPNCVASSRSSSARHNPLSLDRALLGSSTPEHSACESRVVLVPETPLNPSVRMAHDDDLAQAAGPQTILPETPLAPSPNCTASSDIVVLGRRQVPRGSEATPCDDPSVRLSPTQAHASLQLG